MSPRRQDRGIHEKVQINLLNMYPLQFVCRRVSLIEQVYFVNDRLRGSRKRETFSDMMIVYRPNVFERQVQRLTPFIPFSILVIGL
jgi:hypothetical protein